MEPTPAAKPELKLENGRFSVSFLKSAARKDSSSREEDKEEEEKKFKFELPKLRKTSGACRHEMCTRQSSQDGDLLQAKAKLKTVVCKHTESSRKKVSDGSSRQKRNSVISVKEALEKEKANFEKNQQMVKPVRTINKPERLLGLGIMMRNDEKVEKIGKQKNNFKDDVCEEKLEENDKYIKEKSSEMKIEDENRKKKLISEAAEQSKSEKFSESDSITENNEIKKKLKTTEEIQKATCYEQQLLEVTTTGKEKQSQKSTENNDVKQLVELIKTTEDNEKATFYENQTAQEQLVEITKNEETGNTSFETETNLQNGVESAGKSHMDCTDGAPLSPHSDCDPQMLIADLLEKMNPLPDISETDDGDIPTAALQKKMSFAEMRERKPRKVRQPSALPFDKRELCVREVKNPQDFYKFSEDKIGRGRFGEVYRCWDNSADHGLELAAKFIRYTSQKAKKQCLLEVEVLRALNGHPRLVMAYDILDTGKTFVLITEFLSGGELFEHIVDESFTWTDALCSHFSHQICDGVAYMHQNGFVHLDLKPENIVCRSTDIMSIKLIDFGLAERLEDKPKQLNTIKGTALYSAPEVINFDPVYFGTDMWSVGVIVYFLVSGDVPFDGDNELEIQAKVTQGDWTFVEEFDDVVEDAKDFISKLIVKKMESRMTAKECLNTAWVKKSCKSSVQRQLSILKHQRRAKKNWQNAINVVNAALTLASKDKRNFTNHVNNNM